MLTVEVIAKQQGKTKTELARITGITRQNLNAVILGRIPAYPKYKRAIAQALEWPEERAEELFQPVKEVK